MRGIVGALDLENTRIFDANWLRRLVRALAHRGPDGDGFHIEPGVALDPGSCRCKIDDRGRSDGG